MKTREEFTRRVEGFLERTGMSERQFGIEAVSDHKFLNRLRSGAGITLTVIEKAERFIATTEAGHHQNSEPTNVVTSINHKVDQLQQGNRKFPPSR